MFDVGERGGEGLEKVSRRNIRMKPNIRESPIQTWGVRDEGGMEAKEVLSRICTSFTAVGVEGGV